MAPNCMIGETVVGKPAATVMISSPLLIALSFNSGEVNALKASRFAEEPEYFDDEELDKYSCRDSSAFSEDEVEEFREIFYTILDEEKPRWVRSLQMRSISVPDQMKDEVLMFVNELRMQKMHA